MSQIKNREGKVICECHTETWEVSITSAIRDKVSFARADLRGLTLDDIELSHGDFKEADFTGATLERVWAKGADFKGANFTDVKAKEANFSYSCLSSTNFTNADLTNADLSFTNLRFSNLENAKLIGVQTRGARLANAIISSDSGKIIKSHNSFIQISPVGLYQEHLLAFKTDKGLFLRLGTFYGSVQKFNETLELIKKNGVDIKEYEVILQMLDKLMEDNPNEPVET